MVRTFQLTKALSKLTVLENMMLGAKNQGGEHLVRALFSPLWRHREGEVEMAARQLLERFQMSHMADHFAGTLSGGQRKLVEMARALMTDPELVMLDEPMAGVNPALTQSLLGHVKQLRAEGRTVIFVEHDMDVVQRHQRLGGRHGRGSHHRRRPPGLDRREPGGRRRLSRLPPRTPNSTSANRATAPSEGDA